MGGHVEQYLVRSDVVSSPTPLIASRTCSCHPVSRAHSRLAVSKFIGGDGQALSLLMIHCSDVLFFNKLGG